jgi:Family of unknown function (DUF6163)
MSDPLITHPVRTLEPVQEEPRETQAYWTNALVVFLRVMAALSLLKGLYHWALVCGIVSGTDGEFVQHKMAWQATTVFFSVIDLVAAVGLWLLAAWGAVVWLTAAVSMAAVEIFFPEVYGGRIWVVTIEVLLLGGYLLLAIQSAREHPQ